MHQTLPLRRVVVFGRLTIQGGLAAEPYGHENDGVENIDIATEAGKHPLVIKL
ncbi:hypothetical protein [Lacibacter sp.]|uniref:hypothetical protein n=1 Tax=Lacibacter sp. TaxID=1915409 RepID=UPI002B4AC187|nr:hypothetical protein [Lacibacter sp.]HLP37612.1 hypothetical protein [Lacibacter sp.]